MTGSLAGKTLFITGASRGIGLAIGLRAARDGANVAIAAKSVEPQAKVPGTIFTAAKEVEAAGGSALPIACDIRFEEQVALAVEATVRQFGGIDILVNNASAIDLRGIESLEMKRYDLMQQINGRGAYLCAKLALPHLKKAANPHILTLSPPLDMNPKWFSPNLAYTIAKYGMSLVTLGLSRDLAGAGHRHGGGRQSTRRRGGAAPRAQARDRRRRRPRDSCARGADLHRQFLHRRGRAARGGRQGFQVLCRRSQRRRLARLFSRRATQRRREQDGVSSRRVTPHASDAAPRYSV